MIEAVGLTKRFGDSTAVNDLTFTLHPGVVTGFLGPNGAGKSTTMRMILGLDRPTAGSVTVNGRRYEDTPAPMRQVGALLDAKAVEGVRSARAHLRWLARAGGVPRQRVDEVLALVGLTEVADRKIGDFSLGMSQRLGIATAMLGDPPVLLFDEPVNGLDPEGIRWVRGLMRALAAEGRTVLVSSHLMNEMEATADRVLVIGKGQLLADTTVSEFVTTGMPAEARVLTPTPDALVAVIQAAGATAEAQPNGGLIVRGLTAAQVGEAAASAGIVLHELAPQRASLEEAFMERTTHAVEYRTSPEGAR